MKAGHIEEIFGYYGKIKSVDLEKDVRSGLSKGMAIVKYLTSKEAEHAVLHLDGGQIDGQKIKVTFVLVNKRRRGSDGS